MEESPTRPLTGKRGTLTSRNSTTSRRRHICSICARAFSRTEHLVRHERSHRKEKPFPCNYCDSFFSRTDLIKKHIARYHAHMQESNGTIRRPLQSLVPASTGLSSPSNSFTRLIVQTTGNESPPAGPFVPLERPQEDCGQAGIEARSEEFCNDSEAPQSLQIPGDVAPSFAMTAPVPGFDIDTFLGNVPSQSGIPFTPSLTAFDFDAMDALAFDSSIYMQYVEPFNFAEHEENASSAFDHAESANGEASKTIVDSSIKMPFSDPAILSDTTVQPQDSSWLGSFKLSEKKRAELMNVMKNALNGEITYKMTSCFALERFITTFFDAFLLHIPIIHIPSWQAEATHPSLLLVMISIGANFHHEKDLAFSTHRAGHLCIMDHLESTSLVSERSQTWIIQCLFFSLLFSIASGNYEMAQCAFELQSKLATIARCAKIPEYTHDLDSVDKWVEAETTKRTKLGVYTFFNHLTLSYNIPPAIVNSEIDCELPCSEREWTASTRQALEESLKFLPSSTPAFSRVLQSLLPPLELSPIPCSTFGSYIMIHALLQHIWFLRQTLSRNNYQQLADLESSLQRWQTTGQANAEASNSPRYPFEPLAFNSSILLRIAYMRLRVDYGCIKSTATSQNVEAIVKSIQANIGDIEKSPSTTKAALYAIHALRIPVKQGLNLVTRSGSLVWALKQHLYSFELCLFLSRWVETIQTPGAELTEDEIQLETLVKETVIEAGLDEEKSTRPLNAQVIYAWAKMFDCPTIWGTTRLLGDSLLHYADSIRQSDL